MSKSSQELVNAIREGNRPLIEAIQVLTTAVQASAIGGATPAVVSKPAWTAADCDTECDLSGAPYPKRMENPETPKDWNIHPGVFQFLFDKAILPEEYDPDEHGDIPSSYLSPPTVERAVAPAPGAKKARPEWSLETLDDATRPVLMAAAKDVGLKDACKAVGIDYRREKKEWLVKAIKKLADKPTAAPPKPEAEKNIADMERLKKKAAKKKAAKKKKPAKKKSTKKKTTKGKGRKKR